MGITDLSHSVIKTKKNKEKLMAHTQDKQMIASERLLIPNIKCYKKLTKGN